MVMCLKQNVLLHILKLKIFLWKSETIFPLKVMSYDNIWPLPDVWQNKGFPVIIDFSEATQFSYLFFVKGHSNSTRDWHFRETTNFLLGDTLRDNRVKVGKALVNAGK